MQKMHIEPLRKRKTSGELYIRRAPIIALIATSVGTMRKRAVKFRSK
jgi:hypothetical protein